MMKANPGKYSFAQPATGSTPHLAGELFEQKYGLDLVTVPFNGAALAINSTIGGHTPIAFTALPPAMSNIKDGKLRGLAVLATKRSPALPDVPTSAEAGIPDLESDTLTGIVAPAGTPKEIIDKWHNDVVRMVAAPDVKQRLETLGFAPVVGHRRLGVMRNHHDWRNVVLRMPSSSNSKIALEICALRRRCARGVRRADRSRSRAGEKWYVMRISGPTQWLRSRSAV